MFEEIKHFFKKHHVLFASFLIPFIVMAILYIFQGVYPFGNSSLLTIDLGQQYIDFYADFQSNFLTNPFHFFYSFQKSLGGEMIGLSAYYLTSPFNLFFLLFPRHLLSLAVTLLTLIKIGLMGLTFSLYIKKVFPGKNNAMILFSVAYALMGYTIVYQLNLMWLDGLIFLPLICLGLEKLIRNEGGTLYASFLGLTLFSTYYIGYMICLFLPFFFVYRLISTSEDRNWKQTLQVIGHFLFYSLLSAGLVAFLLLPVLSTLLTSKAGYMNTDFSFKLAYPIQEILSKFVIGAFNFDQMPSGLPTIYIGSVSMISFLYYVVDNRFKLTERVYVILFSAFLLISMNMEAFNKIWHAMQYPVWFPYRFAFLFSFFLLLNGYRSFAKGIHFQLKHILIALIVLISTTSYLILHVKEFDYLTLPQVISSSVLVLLFLLLFFIQKKDIQWVMPLLFILAVGELTVNAALTLSNLGYIANDKYMYEVQSLTLFSNLLKEQDAGFFRTEKTFLRSKNDSHQAQYNGITHFSSTFEQDIPELFKHLGFSAHNGFAVYSNSTLVTDSLFGVSYYFNDPKNALFSNNQTDGNVPHQNNSYLAPRSFEWDVIQTKPDLFHYPLVQTIGEIELRKNIYALPIGFGSSVSIKEVNTKNNTPLSLQTDILNGLNGDSSTEEYFVKEDTILDLKNATIRGSSVNRKIQKNSYETDASVEFSFPTNGKDSYYMMFNSSIKEKSVDTFLNNEPFQFYHTYYKPLVFNVGSPSSLPTNTFRMDMKKNEINTTGMDVYRLDTEKFKKTIQDLQKGGLRVETFDNGYLRGTVEIQSSQEVLLLTLPYSKGWKAKVDGKKVKPYKVLDGLMAIDIQPGIHQIEFKFFPPLLIEGISLSLFSFLLLVWIHKKKKS